MCGIVLIGGSRPESAKKVMAAMSYRGLDEQSGLVVEHGWTLGHVRLAIQDLTPASSQPVKFAEGYLAFVGELFNYTGGSELGALVDAYEARGAMGLHRFDGFWALAAVYSDGYAEVITDYLSIKPMYYWAEHMMVCSELEPMFAAFPRPELDEVYLSNCIKFGYDYSGRTPYKGIRQIQPGHRLAFSFATPTPEELPYWNWNLLTSARDAITPGNLRGLFETACFNRLISDRPVALLLSGGLDSSSVYYTLKGSANLTCFSIENGESEYLPEGTEVLHPRLADPTEALQAMQAPLDLGSLLPQFELAQAVASKGFQVCLSGDGADELFGGYSRAESYDSQASDIFCELPYYHLPRLDRLMMRHTIELRSPFLAPSVVGFALRTPRSLRINKWILKDAMKGVVPDEIRNRPKVALKSQAVRQGGLDYRKELVTRFRILDFSARRLQGEAK